MSQNSDLAGKVQKENGQIIAGAQHMACAQKLRGVREGPHALQSLGFSVVCLCTQSFDFAKFATMKWTCAL